MLTTLAVTGPIYLVIALGFLAVRFDVFTKMDMRVLGTFVVKFALPALIFTALSQRPVDDILNARYLIDYAVASVTVMFIAFAWGWWRQGKSFTLSAMCGLGMSSSNSGYIGYPIAVPVPVWCAAHFCTFVRVQAGMIGGWASRVRTGRPEPARTHAEGPAWAEPFGPP